MVTYTIFDKFATRHFRNALITFPFPVHLSARKNTRNAKRIFVKFSTGKFY